jgi:hypothetical protein
MVFRAVFLVFLLALGKPWWLIALVHGRWWRRLLVLRLRVLLCEQQPDRTDEVGWHAGHALLGEPRLSIRVGEVASREHRRQECGAEGGAC